MSNAEDQIDGNDNFSADQTPKTLKERALLAFPAFRSRNFRRYFVGQIVSMIGTWLQMVAQGWLVLEMTGSAFQVGVTAAASSLPTLFLSLFGGVIVDRYDRKTILLWTQGASMLLAFVLGIFTLTGAVTVPIIIALAFLLGCVAAVATPAIQAFLSEMVERDQLHSAVALNAAIFNASRVIGPAIAGLMIAWIGTGGAFMANGLSYVAVIVALLGIHTVAPRKNPDAHQPPLQSIRDGIVYTGYLYCFDVVGQNPQQRHGYRRHSHLFACAYGVHVCFGCVSCARLSFHRRYRHAIGFCHHDRYGAAPR